MSECTRGTLLYADRGRKGSKSKEESKAGKGGKRKRRGREGAAERQAGGGQDTLRGLRAGQSQRLSIRP